MDPEHEDAMIQQLEYLQAEYQELAEDGKHSDHALAYNVKLGTPGSSPEAPVIQGTFTNWHP